MLQADAIEVVRGAKILLDRVDLAVRPGELLALVGPNGAGKSTLLACLAGRLRPDAGRVTLDGRPILTLPPLELARRRAVLSQRLEVPPQLSLEELVTLGRLPHRGRVEQRQQHRIVARCIDEVGLGQKIGQRCGSFSGGELQRAHLARVAAQLDDDEREAPPYLLLDEPTSNLDPAFQEQLLGRARALADRGVGVLAILHDLNQAAAVADRLVVMNAGRLVAEGAPDDVLEPALVRRVYGIDTLKLRHPQSGCPYLLPERSPPFPADAAVGGPS